MALPFHTAWAETADFYRSNRPGNHFRTSSRSSSHVARTLATIVVRQWTRLGMPDDFTVTDVGADDGHLLSAIRAHVPEHIRVRTRWQGVDIVPGICDLEWEVRDIAREDLPPFTGVLIAQELLDDIPCPVVENDEDGMPWVIGVDSDGALTPMVPLADPDDRAWLDRWWPDTSPYALREVGRSRDHVWQRLRRSVHAGLAIAIDYGHVRAERCAGRWAGGTMRAFRSGRVVRAIPDGRCNITADVAMDSLADGVLHRQREMTGIGGAEGHMLWLLDDRGTLCVA